MTTEPTTIAPWPEGGAEALRCQSCGAAWVIDRHPDVDNAEMMTERMADHFCFPGVTTTEVDEVWAEARRLADPLGPRLWEYGQPAEELSRDEWTQLSERHDREKYAGEEVALHFGCKTWHS